ncbi:uncharacterized protein LOC132698568 [Cylas formicarius]|uniref:uncharacterized protein LOC132698568 n=1 Tax=Cylas formicarius TaxID=197179 RepID=UPI002958330E|nr:uncharacterized protein LOC132698568 [Cylas formicarius]
MKTAGLWLMLLIGFACFSISYQYVLDSVTCFDKPCPSGTTNCKKQSKSTADKRRLQIKITCLDEFDSSLKEYHYEEASALDPHTHYQSTSFQSAQFQPYRRTEPENYYYGGEDFL